MVEDICSNHTAKANLCNFMDFISVDHYSLVDNF